MRLYKSILGYRKALLLVLVTLSVAIAFYAIKVQLSYEFPKILPAKHSDYQAYLTYKKSFGEDGKTLMIGVKDTDLYSMQNLAAWRKMRSELVEISGVSKVLDFTSAIYFEKDRASKTLLVKNVFPDSIHSQPSIDSALDHFKKLPVYASTIYNGDSGVQIMAIVLHESVMANAKKKEVISQVRQSVVAFEEHTRIDTHLSGMIYIRSEMSEIISAELILFIGLSLLICSAILYFFYRSFKIVLFATFIVGVGMLFSLALIYLLNFKINILTGLIPSLIIIIGIPNCILLINRYHEEYKRTHHKLRSLALTVQKVGQTTFLANLTTAIGFGVFVFTGSPLLREFGLVASISVIFVFLICLIFIPITMSFVKVPGEKKTRHLDAIWQKAFLLWLNGIVHGRRKAIYIIAGILVLISLFGITQIRTIGYFVDDLPPGHPLFTDLKFFERHFTGVLPMEIIFDTQNEKGVQRIGFINKLRKAQKIVEEYPEISAPAGPLEALKFTFQGYKGGDEKNYRIPNYLDYNAFSPYLKSLENSVNESAISYSDSLKQSARVSYRIADVGSKRVLEIHDELALRLDSVFNFSDQAQAWLPEEQQVKVSLTGNSYLFAKGNQFLVENLKESVLLAVVLISLIMALQFRSLKMMVIAIIPSILPLLVTAGLMGYFDIALKPATILIYSIAFGIASDGTLYFLTRFKQEHRSLGGNYSRIVAKVISETGRSMIYTAAILFFGFAIFAASSFAGTSALGILLSITLLVGMLSNLILLPALILSVNKGTIAPEVNVNTRLKVTQ